MPPRLNSKWNYDYLRDPLILREHLRHILSVGWTSRVQFEYEYVNLLTLLHNLSDDYYMPMSTSRGDLSGGSMDSSSATNVLGGDAMINNLPAEEIKERNKAICLVIKGIDFFLLYIISFICKGNARGSILNNLLNILNDYIIFSFKLQMERRPAVSTSRLNSKWNDCGRPGTAAGNDSKGFSIIKFK
jgi:hypothetical protein